MAETQREALWCRLTCGSCALGRSIGTVMAHLGFLGEVHLAKGLGDIDDDELIAVLYRHKAELTARLEGYRTRQPHQPQARSPFQEVQLCRSRPQLLSVDGKAQCDLCRRSMASISRQLPGVHRSPRVTRIFPAASRPSVVWWSSISIVTVPASG